MKKTIRIIFKVLAATLATLALLLIAIWLWPNLVLNRNTLFPIANFFLKPAKLSGDAEVFEIHSTGVLAKHVEFRFKDLCYTASPEQRLCFPSAAISADLNLTGDTLVALQNLEVREGSLLWKVAEATIKENEQPSNTDQLLPEAPKFLSKVTLDRLRIELKSVKVTTASGSLSTFADLSANGAHPPIQWILKTDGDYRLKDSIYRWKGDLSAQSTKSLWSGPFELRSHLVTVLPEKGKANLKLSANLDPKKVAFDITTDGAMGKKKLKGRVQGEMTTQSAKVTLNASVGNIVPQFPSIAVSECRIEMNKKKASETAYKVNCPTILTGAFCQFSEGICEEVFKNTSATLVSDIKLVGETSEKQEISGNVSLKVESLFQRIKEGRASLAVDVAGKLKNFPDELTLNSKADLEITSFAKIVSLFKQRPWSIPAPLNALDGTIEVSADAKGNILKEGGELPLQIHTDLASQNQALRVDGNGKLLLKQEAATKTMYTHLDLDVVLSDVQIALPHLAATAPPPAFPDGRIQMGDKKQETTPSTFTYEVRVSTAAQPIRVYSNLAKLAIPITINITSSSDGGTTGAVRVSAFPVELFRRKATIEHLYLSLKRDPRYNEINGKLMVKHTDYTVYILLLGLADRPEIKFQSEPPLPEADVLSVLIFGKKPETLTSDEASSVGNTRAAVQDNALNLASMYLLASTPVESVGYDPLTKSFNAKIRLRDGTSVTVGSDFKDINQLGLRQRLGSNWSIATYVTDPFSVVNRTLTALLEWSVGY